MKYTSDIVKGIVLAQASDYNENNYKKNIDVSVEECGPDFKVKVWFPVSLEKSDFDIFIVSPSHSIKAIRQLTESCMESINPFKESINV